MKFHRQLLALFILFHFVTSVNGQVNQKDKFNICVGFGGALYNTSYTFDDGFDYYTEKNLEGGSAYWNVNVSYAVEDWVSLGLNFKRGYFYSEDILDEVGIINNISAQGRFFFLNKNKFGMFGNVSYGLSYLKLAESDAPASEYKWRGTDLGVGAGYKWLWSDHVGMYMVYEYNMYNLAFTFTETEAEIRQKANGGEIRIGLSFKI